MIPQDPKRLKFGPYLSLKPVDPNGSDTTYYAIHQESGQRFWLRVIVVNRQDADAIIDACLNQLAQIQQFDLPHTVKIADFGRDDQMIYIASPIMIGGTLGMRLQHYHDMGEDQASLPSLQEVARFIQQISIALDAIHSHDLVHGQVDPRYIMFDEAGTAYLAEVGASRLTKLIYGLDTTNSFDMSRYSAPEQWDGSRPEPASDRYSLACIAYELVTGQPPFLADSIYNLMQSHLNDVVMPPHAIRHNLPQALALPFWQALAKPVHRRHPSAQAFADEFAFSIQGHEASETSFFRKPLP